MTPAHAGSSGEHRGSVDLAAQHARDLAARLGLSHDPSSRFTDLTSELGELAKELLAATDFGARPFAPTKAWTDELGDVIFALVLLAQATGTDLAESLSGAIEKYEARLRTTGSIGSQDPL